MPLVHAAPLAHGFSPLVFFIVLVAVIVVLPAILLLVFRRR